MYFVIYHLTLVLFFTVPSSSPEQIEATLLNTTAVFLKWRPPSNDSINGKCLDSKKHFIYLLKEIKPGAYTVGQ